MRLQVPLLVGPVVDPLVPTKEPQEPTTVTPAEIIYHRRVQVLDRAGQTSVTEACRTFGISRTTYYRWAGRAQRYGLAALLPKGRRPPVMPTATPPDQVEAVLAEAVARPTIGAQRLVDHLADRGVRRSPSGVQKLLRRHRLGRRAQRVAALAQLTAATSGIMTAQAKDGPSGPATSPPVLAIWSPWTPSMSASPEGIGPVWQLTAVDTATRYAIGRLVAGDKSARDAAAFVDHVAERLCGIGVELAGVLTDNGPEFTGHGFTSHLEDLGIGHRRIPPRSPNHNAVCERFQGTALQEFYRPAFHRQHFARLARPGRPVPGLATALQHPAPQPRQTSCAAATPFAVMEAHLS
jgi:transposase InsO family protein